MSLAQWLFGPIRQTFAQAPAFLRSDPTGAQQDINRQAASANDAIAALERQRLAALTHRRRILFTGIPLLLTLTASVHFLFLQFTYDSPAFFVITLGGLVLWGIAAAGVWIFRKSAKQRLLPALAEREGLEYQMQGVEPDIFATFRQQELFGGAVNNGQTEDVFSGAIDDIEFVMFEARQLRTGNDGGSSTVYFQGLCMRLGFPKRFSGVTRILDDRGPLNPTHDSRSTLERVRLEDSRFERAFEVFSTDQVEARYLLTPALMERLFGIRHVLGERTVMRAAFVDRHLLLTFDTRKNRSVWQRLTVDRFNPMPHFEVNEINRPVNAMRITRQFEHEIASCKELVSTLKLNMRTRV